MTSKSNLGLQYENLILKTLRAVRDKPFAVARPTGAFSSADPDLVLKFGRKEMRIEIKANPYAQMGGGSYYFDAASKKFTLVNEKDDGEHDAVVDRKILDSLKLKTTSITKLLDYAKKHNPKTLADGIKGFSFRTTKKVWKSAVDKGMLRDINNTSEMSLKFMFDHYKRKKCFYIQIGGKKGGLYYMSANPMNLPVPQLTANLLLEMRATTNGGAMNKTVGEEVATAALRVQGRLDQKSLTKSPYSLERTSDYERLFGAITKADIDALP